MSKLVIVVGDYSAGTIENAMANKEDIATLRSGDSADGRVLSELVAQDPDVARIITLPVSRQFNPSSAGALTKEAIRFGFDILEHPGTVKGFEDVTEISIVGNVAPGIKSLSGSAVGQSGKESNADREAFIDGSVSKNGKTIHVGTTNTFFDGQGHALGAVTELQKEGYTLSEFKAVSGEEAHSLLRENGQFRSRALLPYMNRVAGKPHDHEGEDLIPLARAQHALVSDETKRADEEYAKNFLQLEHFLPVIPGSARQGFTTVISSSRYLDSAMAKWSGTPQYSGQLFSGLSFDGNETMQDRKVIAELSKKEQENYRMTRQAFLAANLANEYDYSYGSGQRTIIIDSHESAMGKTKYDVTLKSGTHIIAGTPKLFAFTTGTIDNVSMNGKPLQSTEYRQFLWQAEEFRNFLKDKAVENDPYRNVKLGRTFGENLKEVKHVVKEAMGNEIVPDGKAAALTVVAKTGDLMEERTVYYIPTSTSSFGIWGHPKLSSGSTLLDKPKSTDNRQSEFFTPGCPTAGYLFTVVPGVTQFYISRAQLIDKSLLDTPSLRITGHDREYGARRSIDGNRVYHDVHGKHVRDLLRKVADEKITPLSGGRDR